MKSYTVEFVRSARTDLENLPTAVVRRVMPAIRKLQETPRPRGCRKLVDQEATFRIRVGDYRVVYEVDDKAGLVLIVRVRHRGKAYQ